MAQSTANVGSVVFSRADNPSLVLHDGETVSVRILSKIGIHARVAINGHLVAAKTPLNASIGDVFRMFVKIEGSTIYLIPQTEPLLSIPVKQTLFSQLGLPNTELISTLITFFHAINSKIDPKIIQKLSQQAFTFSPEEKKAAFVAALLYERGIEPTKELIEKLMYMLYGSDGFSEEGQEPLEDDSDLMSLINHLQGSSRHWIIIPYTQTLGEVEWKGSLALLLDLEIKECLEFCMRAQYNDEAWIFTIKEKVCFFEREDCTFEWTKEEKKYIIKHIKECFEQLGMSDLSFVYGKVKIDMSDITPSLNISV